MKFSIEQLENQADYLIETQFLVDYYLSNGYDVDEDTIFIYTYNYTLEYRNADAETYQLIDDVYFNCDESQKEELCDIINEKLSLNDELGYCVQFRKEREVA